MVKLWGKRKFISDMMALEGSVKKMDAAASGGVLGAGSRRSKKGLGVIGKYASIATKSVAGMGAAFVAIGATKVVGDMMNFEQAIQSAGVAAGMSDKQIKGLQKGAMDIAETTRWGNTEVANSMLEIAKAGKGSVPEINKFAKGAALLAQATGSDLVSSTDTMISTMAQFELGANNADSVANLLTKTANATQIDIADIASSLKYAGPVAKTFGTNLQDTLIAISIMGQSGIKASQAGTTLRASMVRLIKPTKIAKGALKDMGLNAEQLRSKNGLLPLPQLLAKIRGAYNRMGKAGKGAQAKADIAQIIGREPLSGFLTLLTHGEKGWKKYTKAIVKNGNTAAKQGERQQQTIQAQLSQTGNYLENQLMRPIMKYSPQIQQFFKDLRDPKSSLRKTLQPFIDTLSILFGIIWDAVKIVLPDFITLIVIVSKVFKVLNKVLKFLKPILVPAVAIFITLAGTFGLVSRGVSIGIRVVRIFVKAWGWISRIFKASMFIKGIAFVAGIKSLWALRDVFIKVYEKVKEFFDKNAWAKFLLVFATWPFQMAKIWFGIGQAIIKGISDGIGSLAGSIGDFIWSLIPAPLRWVLEKMFGGGGGANALVTSGGGLGGVQARARTQEQIRAGTFVGPLTPSERKLAPKTNSVRRPAQPKQQQSPFTGGGGGSNPFTIQSNLFLDGKQVAQSVQKAGAKRRARGG